MRRRDIACLLLGAMIVVGCASGPTKGHVAAGHGVVAVPAATSPVRYDLDHGAFKTVDVLQGVQGTVQFDLKASGDTIWLMRYLGDSTDYAAYDADGHERVPLTHLPGVRIEASPFDRPSWLPVGGRLLVRQGEFNPLGRSKAKLLQVYPEPRKEQAVDPGQVSRLVAASKTGFYVLADDARTLTEMDLDFHPIGSFKVKSGVNRVEPISDKELLIGNALFSLESKDFYWDQTGTTYQTLNPGVSEWKAFATDPSGVMWFATYGAVGGKLRLVAMDREGQLLVDKVVAPHDFDPSAGIALAATDQYLLAGVVGYYQGEKKLLIYTFKRSS